MLYSRSMMKLLSKVIFTFITLIVAIKQLNCFFFTPPSTQSAQCPPAHLFHPCECYLHAESMKIIRCGGDTIYELSLVFESLSHHLLGSEEKHFHMFYLNNTAIEVLGNVFLDITFDYIYFDGANNLQAIHANAFDITGPYVKELRAFGTKLKQSSLEEFLQGLSNLQHLTVSNVGQCPPEELLKPCKCVYRSAEWQWVKAKFTRIVCGEESEEDLTSLYALYKNRTKDQIGYYTTRRIQVFFDRLSDSLARINWQKRFDEFVIQHSPITELPRNMFNDIIFYAIRVDNCPNMQAIHPMAFTITEPFVQELLVRRTKLANDRWKQRDTYNAITSLSNLRVLYLHWSGLQSIPHHAFRPLKGRFQRKLVKISIKYENYKNLSLRTIGSYAFYYLPNLRTIDLSMNSIVKIYRNAFSLRWPSNEAIEVNLSGNNLTDNSIEPSAFSEAQRPVHIILGQWLMGNQYLTHLDEAVFRSFLKENPKNRVRLHSSQHSKGGNRIICDCQSRWLFDNYGRIKKGLEDIMCVSNTSWSCLPPCLIYGQDVLHCGSTQRFNIGETFKELSRNLAPHETHFIKFVLSNTEIETIPANAFGNITFEQLEFDGCTKLRQIDQTAFEYTAKYLSQVVVKNTANLSRWPSNAFRLSQFPNLTHLDISFDGYFHLFNDTFESDIESNRTLFIRLNIDNMHNDSIETNALNGAKRPIHLFFDSKKLVDSRKGIVDPIGCQSPRLEETIYAQFLANNPYNQINVMWCPLICDCSIKWLFDAPQDWWRRVDAGDPSVGLQCHDQRSLHFYSDNDFRNCPKTNLLKYFVKDKSFTTTTISTVISNITTAYYIMDLKHTRVSDQQILKHKHYDGSAQQTSYATTKASTEPLTTKSITTTEVMPQEISVYSELDSVQTETKQIETQSTISDAIPLTTKEVETFTEKQYSLYFDVLNVRTRSSVEIQPNTTTTTDRSFTSIKIDENNSVFSGNEEAITDENISIAEVSTISTDILDIGVELTTLKQYDNHIEYRTDITDQSNKAITKLIRINKPEFNIFDTLSTTDSDLDLGMETTTDTLTKLITENSGTPNNTHLSETIITEHSGNEVYSTSTAVTDVFTDILLDKTSVMAQKLSTDSEDSKYVDKYIDYDSFGNSERVSTIASEQTTDQSNKTNIDLSATTTANIDNNRNYLYQINGIMNRNTETVSTHQSVSSDHFTTINNYITITGNTAHDSDNIDYLTIDPAN